MTEQHEWATLLNLVIQDHRRTVPQSCQQGDETDIQKVPIVVQTHEVAVQHPAQLRG